MTDTDYDYEGDEGQANEPPAPNWRRKLEADAKAGREAIARAEAAEKAAAGAQRELAMRRANVDLDSPLGQMFAKAYDGPDDVDSMTSQWSAISGQAPRDTSGVPAAQQQAMAAMSGAIGGAAPTGGYAPDFEADLDSVPVLIDGNWNPNYINQILDKTAEQAGREGRQFVADGAGVRNWHHKGGQHTPATTPLR